MTHYFTDNRHLDQNRKEFSFRFWCFNYTFITDNGVFAKGGIDEGSKILLNTLGEQELGSKILDVGCGYGTIGVILGKKFTNAKIDMIDVNPRALELAQLNLQKNDVEANVFMSDGLANVENRDYTDIVTNPPIRAGKKVIYSFFENSYDHLINGGNLWVVIRRQHGAESAIKFIKEKFGNCEVINKDKGFYILRATK